MWETYYSVSSLSDALSLLNEHQDSARIVAGGTDLMLELERGQRPQVTKIIDITRIAGLDQITLHGETIRIGPLVNHNHIVASDLIRERALPLAQASWEVGAPQIRNRATIAGNLITASPANDTITPLIALGAELILSSVDGERTVALQDFYSGFRQTVLRPNEMLTAITFPALGTNERGVFMKLGLRRAQAISVVDAAVVIAHDDNKIVTSASITLGSVAPTIIRTPVAEQALVGKSLTTDVIAEVARLASITPTPIDDVRSTAEYRTEMIKVLVARALRNLAQDEVDSGIPDNPPMLWGDNHAIVQNGIAETIEHDASTPIATNINGQDVTISTGQHKSLLHWLRDDAKLIGTKEGCGEGECGACTVFLDGVAVMSCMVHAPRAHNADIVTVEGLQQNEELHPIQSAFIQEAAVQCGYCTPGFLMSGVKLLDEIENPSEEQINYSISGNLCRCTGYYKIVQAFQEASKAKQQS